MDAGDVVYQLLELGEFLIGDGRNIHINPTGAFRDRRRMRSHEPRSLRLARRAWAADSSPPSALILLSWLFERRDSRSAMVWPRNSSDVRLLPPTAR
jgi:hypothetical protein